MIPAIDRWGPFADGIGSHERIALLRCLTAITHLSCGPRGVELVSCLRTAEADATALPVALAALNRMAPLDRRRIWASYAALSAPALQRRRQSNPEDRA